MTWVVLCRATCYREEMNRYSFFQNQIFNRIFAASLLVFLFFGVQCGEQPNPPLKISPQMQRLSDGSYVTFSDRQVIWYPKDGSPEGKKEIVSQDSSFLFAQVLLPKREQVLVQASADKATIYSPLDSSKAPVSLSLEYGDGPKQILASYYESTTKLTWLFYKTSSKPWGLENGEKGQQTAYFHLAYDDQGQNKVLGGPLFLEELKPEQRELQQVRFSDDGTCIVAVLQGGHQIGVWSSNGSLVQVLEGGNQKIKQIYVSGNKAGTTYYDNNLQVISVGERGETILWKPTTMGGDLSLTEAWKMTTPTSHQKEAVGFEVWSDGSQIFWIEWIPQPQGHRVRILNMLQDILLGEFQIDGEITGLGMDASYVDTRMGTTTSVRYEKSLYVATSQEVVVYPLQDQAQDRLESVEKSATSAENHIFATVSSLYRTPAVWQWDGKKVNALQSYTGHDSAVKAVALSADGTKMVSLTEKGTLLFWRRNGNTYEQLQKILNASNLPLPSCIAMSGDGNTVLVGYASGVSVRKLVWNGSQYIDKVSNISLKDADSILSITMSGDGNMIAVGDASSKVYLFRYTDGYQSTLVGHGGGVENVYLSDVGDVLLSQGGTDGIVRVWKWNGTNYSNIKTFSDVGAHPIVSMSLNGTAIAISSVNMSGIGTTMRIWNYDFALSDYVKVFERSYAHITAIALSFDGSFILKGEYDGTVTLLRRVIKNYEDKQTLSTHTSAVTSASFSRDANFIVTGGKDNILHVSQFDAPTNSYILKQNLLGHAGRLTSVAISQDGNLVVTGGQDGTAHVWKQESGLYKDNQILTVPKKEVQNVLLSQDGSKLITLASVKMESMELRTVIVWVWDGTLYQSVQTLSSSDLGLESLEKEIALSGDGELLGINGNLGTQILKWNGKNYEKLQLLSKEDFYNSTLSISLDGNVVVSFGKVWRKRETDAYEQQTQILSNPIQPNRVALSKDGETILTSEMDQATYMSAVHVWKNRGDHYEVTHTWKTSMDSSLVFVSDISLFADGNAFLISSGNGTTNEEYYLSNPIGSEIHLSLSSL